MVPGNVATLWVLVVSFLNLLGACLSKVPQEEVDTLQKIVSAMGATYWKFNADSCSIDMVGLAPRAPQGSVGQVNCDCNSNNSNACHIVKIVIKGYNLPGVLSPELVNLPYIQEIDFAYNYLHSTIPPEWSSIQLNSLSVLVNRLSGEIPKELGNIRSLKYLNLEANQFSGAVPAELGQLISLQTLILSSNQLTGNIPASLSGLINLTDFRINDNNFSGPIPGFIQNWKQLQRLEMHATGLHGPFPANISLLNKLITLRISDVGGPAQQFPALSANDLQIMVLRNCNISGEIPTYVWDLVNLRVLDVSFNKLMGFIPDVFSVRSLLKFLFVTGNKLSGDVPPSILQNGNNIDLSYNNFTWQGPERPACQPNLNLYINLFKSSSTVNNLRNILPCTKEFTCPTYRCSFYINAGGNDFGTNEGGNEVLYEGDGDVDGGSARYFRSSNYWGLSSTGDFMDDNNAQNKRFLATVSSTNFSDLYRTARLSPLSLTYFFYCMENGNYTVNLHFAEILFTNDKTYSSLGRRIFDIYIQDILVRKDFNIEDVAHGALRSVILPFNATVMDTILEIRFNWGGKGTTRIPSRGVYGPLVSAISVIPNFKSCSTTARKNVSAFVSIGVVGVFIIILTCGFLWWKRYFGKWKRDGEGMDKLETQLVSFTLKQLKYATKNFDTANKIGEGGFGPVYKGLLPDGTVIAVKQLSSKSRQGNREFLNEIALISCVQHPNLVKLCGCCMEEDQLMLVYEYMENNSLAKVLFDESEMILDWPTRFRIAVGIAKGLAFLHEESRLKIVHRDIKATNVLLDRNLNPKISDFGLARLNEDERTHISTRVAGTIGYMAPEYALWGYLTDKADVYSFGVLLLEIVSGKNNNTYLPSNNCICLLDWACQLQQSGKFVGILDRRLSPETNKEEIERMVKVALLCTSASPSLRPTMSEVVSVLEGRMPIPETVPEASNFANDLRFKALKEFHQEKQQSQSLTISQTRISSTMQTDVGSSSASSHVSEINLLKESS